MLHFRKMNIDDLEFIFRDEDLSCLLTVPPLGEKFGMLIEEDGIIKGGATGYSKGQGAMFQMLKVKDPNKNCELLEGLLRATIYMLDIENIKAVFSKTKEENPYINVGFKRIDDSDNRFSWEIDKVILDDISNEPYVFLDVESFFNEPCSK